MRQDGQSGPGARARLLEKVLALEERKGFQDTAVAGGLERFAARQLAGLDGPLASARGLLAGYGRLDPAARADRVARVRALLDGRSASARAPLADRPAAPAA
ncbi:MAG: DNA helicase RecG, partial [Thermomicrobiaceae bacterium]|nr:DNA helicase RecG [Thermomicrobiaceae bacterium]